MNGANENCLAESKLYIKNYHLAKVALLLLQPVWTLLSIAQSAGSADCFTPPPEEKNREILLQIGTKNVLVAHSWKLIRVS